MGAASLKKKTRLKQGCRLCGKAYSPAEGVIIGMGDIGGGWVAHCKVSDSGELHKALPKMIYVICKLEAIKKIWGVDELKHLFHGEGVERTNRHERSFRGRQ